MTVFRNAGAIMVVAVLSAVSVLFGGDAERHGSAAMNAAPAKAREREEGGTRVLFLGNSMVLHSPLPSIGWTNDWGMAASAKERDFVHLVTRGIEARTGRKADMRLMNLADFERDFANWKPEDHLAEERSFHPEYLVIALGENSPDVSSTSRRREFRQAYSELVGYFLRGRADAPHTVIRGTFWPNAVKNEELRAVADGLGVAFVDIESLGRDPTMTAAGLFDHKGVAAHPGDRGMAAIAEAILTGLFPTGRSDTPTGERPHIVSKLEDVARYEALNPHFAKAFEFLRRKDLVELPVGRHEIDGENCWAMVQTANLTPMEEETTVEVHRRYVDIQAPITGDETIGLCAFDTNRTDLVFDEKKDIVFFKAKVEPKTLHPGEFAIFFPRKDAHAPGHCIGEIRTIRKLVVKVKAE